MPLPRPRKDESKNDFVSRCMGSPTMRSEFPKQAQRAAVCHAQFDKGFRRPDMSTGTLTRYYGSTEGPLGFPMRPGVAKEADAALKQQPTELRSAFSTDINGQRVVGYLRSTDAKSIEMKEGERADISIFTTASVDRDREMIYPDGGNFAQYLKNPAVTFGHDYKSLPIGRTLWIKRQASPTPAEDGWLGKIQYTPPPDGWTGNWLPDAVLHMIANGDLPAKSVGLIPLDGRPPTQKDIETRPDLAGARFLVMKWMAVEISVVPIGANPDALVQMAAKGFGGGIMEIIQKSGVLIPPPPRQAPEDPTEEEPDIVAAPSIKGARTYKQYREERQRVFQEALEGANVGSMVSDAIDLARGRV